MKDRCGIVVRPQGGLCNRMRAIAATYTLARKVDKKTQLVWVVDGELGACYEELFQPIEGIPVTTYRWGGAEQKGSILERMRAAYYSKTIFNPSSNLLHGPSKVLDLTNLPKYRAVRWKLLRWIKRQARRVEFDLAILQGPAKSKLTESEIESITSSRKTLIITQYEFIKPDIPYETLFRLQPKLKELVDTAARNITDQTIGVHIRRTDHGRAIEKSPESAFRRVMKTKIKVDPDATFFLATDSAETKKSLQEEFGDRILSNDVPLTRGNTSGLQGAVIDLYCLAQTKKILGSHVSSFSKVAAKIGGIPLVRVSPENEVTTQ